MSEPSLFDSAVSIMDSMVFSSVGCPIYTKMGKSIPYVDGCRKNRSKPFIGIVLANGVCNVYTEYGEKRIVIDGIQKRDLMNGAR